MYVRDVMTRTPEACTPEDTCATAGWIMQRRNCGFVPVVETLASRWVIGVLTDRDLALYLTGTDRSAGEVLVLECMTHWPKTVAPEAELDEAAQLMEAYGLHRLPVVEDGRLIGVLSVTDIARVARAERVRGTMDGTERQLTDLVESLAIGH